MISAAQPSSTGVTALDVLTLTIATVGALTGVVALVLQAVFFRRSGPAIRVELKWALIGDGGAITLPVERMHAPVPDGYDHQRAAVEVRNTGRAAATVQEIALELA